MVNLDDYDEKQIWSEPKKIKKHKIEKYVGIEYNFPNYAKSQQELYEICKQLDVYHWREIEVNHWALIESQVQGLLTQGEVTVLYYLCNKVENWNVCFCNIKDLPCHEKKAYTFIKSLSPWSLRVVENNRGALKIQMSPFLVWKGDKNRRDKQIREWYGRKTTVENNN